MLHCVVEFCAAVLNVVMRSCMLCSFVTCCIMLLNFVQQCYVVMCSCMLCSVVTYYIVLFNFVPQCYML